MTNDYSDFNGVNVGMPTEERWNYPTIGYNSREGVFYVGEEQAKEVTLILLAIRQCKEIEDSSGTIHRYPLRTRKADMVDGDFTSRWQGICYVDDELYVFGARSWTARAAFMNPGGGPYSDANFERGIWHNLIDHVKEVGKETGKQLPPLCWQFTIKSEDKAITVGTGKNTSKSHRIIQASEFKFIGGELANGLAMLYESEALEEWGQEWNKRTVETYDEPEETEPVPLELDDVPF